MIIDMKYLSIPLPKHIEQEIISGHHARAIKGIDLLLADQTLLAPLKNRLLIEKERLSRVKISYPYNEEQALQMLKQLDSSYQKDDLWDLCTKGYIDWRYIDHEPRFFVRFLKSLVKTYPEFAKKAGEVFSGENPFLDSVIGTIQQQGKASYLIEIEGEIRIEPEAFIPNEEYTFHVPIPAESAQNENIQLFFDDVTPSTIDPPHALARTAAFTLHLKENTPIKWRYSYTQTIHNIDFSRPPAQAIYQAPPPSDQDLSQQAPHIFFSPYLKALAASLVKSEKDPLTIARTFYDYVTTQVDYAFVPQYFFIDDIAQYTAINRKGDCGLQALLFITLCRIAGIPARWQSGLCISNQDVGFHDWAQFYIAPFGWLFCDCSFGGTAFRKGNLTRWNFYFGHLDPFRMVANHRFQEPFLSEKKHWRVDPYDNQGGECECSSKGFTSSEFDTNYTLLQLVKQ
ncbi:MAG: transglutaminase domain-containing protein [Clostridiales bacterium]|nr:transglutaminase domain-containing protein [Clostridiales bacterium]